MPNKPITSAKQQLADTADLEEFVDAFEAELARSGAGGDVAVRDFLPNESHPEFDEILVELLRVDFEHRWNRGLARSIDTYLNRFAATLADPKHREPLAFEEYRLRCQSDVNVDRATYATKYNIDVSKWPSPSRLGSRSTRDVPASVSDGSWPSVGEQIADFKIVAEFGRGAFSRVYLAQQGTLANRLVVLKASKHFWKESDLLARLQHSNIVPIHSVHGIGDTQIVCMPFWGTCTLADFLTRLGGNLETALSAETFRSTVANLQNETVVSILRERKELRKTADRPAPSTTADQDDTLAINSDPNGAAGNGFVDTCLSLAEQIAEGLSHAHQRGIIHGDLKPANVLIADDARPMILDFNLSVEVDDPTATAGVGGTIPYMAPEHLRKMNGEASRCTAASDVFALGVILFELLTGKKPFSDRGGDFEKAYPRLIRDREHGAPSVLEHNPGVSEGVAAIVAKCLAPELKNRYSSADQLLEDLRRQSSNRPLKHVAEPTIERLAKLHRSKPRLVYGIVASFACLVALICLSAFATSKAQHKRDLVTAKQEEFGRVMDWLPASLNTARIDRYRLESTMQQANHWLTNFSPKELHRLSPQQREELNQHTGELLLSVANLKVSEAQSVEAEEKRVLLEEASMLIQSAIPLLPHSEFACLSLQREILRSRSEAEGSTYDEGIAIDVVPVTALDFETLGEIRRRSGQILQSIEALEQAADKSPRDYSVWLQLGNAYTQQQSFSDAERCFTMCLALRPRVPEGYMHRLLARLEIRDVQGALRDATRFLELRPDDVQGHFNRALILQHLEQHQEAEADLTKAIELAQDTSYGPEPRFYLLRSQSRHTLGDKVGGEDDLETGLRLMPMDERNLLARGMAFLRRGNAVKALQDFREALKLNPNSVNAMKNVAHVLSDHLDRKDDAIDTLNMALRAKPKDADLLGGVAVLEARSGEVVSARTAIERALEIDQEVATLIRAASVYSLTRTNEEDRSKALDYVKQALATEPKWARYLQHDPDLKGVSGDKRFQELIEAANKLLP